MKEHDQDDEAHGGADDPFQGQKQADHDRGQGAEDKVQDKVGYLQERPAADAEEAENLLQEAVIDVSGQQIQGPLDRWP